MLWRLRCDSLLRHVSSRIQVAPFCKLFVSYPILSMQTVAPQCTHAALKRASASLQTARTPRSTLRACHRLGRRAATFTARTLSTRCTHQPHKQHARRLQNACANAHAANAQGRASNQQHRTSINERAQTIGTHARTHTRADSALEQHLAAARRLDRLFDGVGGALERELLACGRRACGVAWLVLSTQI